MILKYSVYVLTYKEKITIWVQSTIITSVINTNEIYENFKRSSTLNIDFWELIQNVNLAIR